LLATLAGLAAAIWAFGATGWASVGAVAARLGVGGFALFCLWSLGQFVLLGAAWLVAAPGERAERLGLFAWARIVRESAADLLPFSQIGGIVISVRTLVQAGVPAPLVCASMIADLVTEMASQLVLTLLGLGLMAAVLLHSPAIRPLVFGGTAAMIAVMAAFFVAQRRGLAIVGRLAARLVPGSVATMAGIEAERARIFASPRRIGAAFALNMLAWLATTGGAALVLHLIGTTLPFARVLSLEVLIFTLRSVAFAVPGAIGFQEAAYALAGPLLGVPAESALALSLAKRARDLAIGIPALVIWQIGEARALARSAAGRDERRQTRDDPA
jgi:putative membrane protein